MGRARDVSKSAEIQVVPTDYGYTYAGIRDMGDDDTTSGGYHWVLPGPCARRRPELRRGALGPRPLLGARWTTTAPWSGTSATPSATSPSTKPRRIQDGLGNTYDVDVDPKTFRSYNNASNNWMIDREDQKNNSYTGIKGTNTQDRTVQETMGPILDRT